MERVQRGAQLKVVASIPASLMPSVGLDAKGNPIVTNTIIPGKTGYLCDDGVTYYR